MNINLVNDKKIVILGDGQVGKTLSNALCADSIVITRNNINFADTDAMQVTLHTILDNVDILCIINAIAYTNVDLAEKERELSYAINATAIGILSHYCQSRDVPLIHFSTDFVFDGTTTIPYIESDYTNPINHYGHTKLDGEKIAFDNHSKVLLFRIAWVYSPLFDNNFVAKIVKMIMNDECIVVVNDQVGNLCNTFDLTNIILTIIDMLRRSEKTCNASFDYGLYHLGPRYNFVSRYDIAKEILDICHHSFGDLCITKEIMPIATRSLSTLAKRPLNSMLNSEKFFNEFKCEMSDWKLSLHNAIHKIVRRMTIIDSKSK